MAPGMIPDHKASNWSPAASFQGKKQNKLWQLAALAVVITQVLRRHRRPELIIQRTELKGKEIYKSHAAADLLRRHS